MGRIGRLEPSRSQGSKNSWFGCLTTKHADVGSNVLEEYEREIEPRGVGAGRFHPPTAGSHASPRHSPGLLHANGCRCSFRDDVIGMKRTWIIVAHRTGARFLTTDGENGGLRVVQELEHPEGRKKSGDIDADAPGMAFSKGGQGGGHPMGREQDAHERVAADFAHDIAEQLHSGRTQNHFDELVLVAEPRFLGMLRDALDRTTAARVKATIHKDLSHTELRDLPKHLTPTLKLGSHKPAAG